MEKLGIPEAEIKFAMRKGEVDLLTVIPIEDLERGIAFACRIMQYIDEELQENPPKGTNMTLKPLLNAGIRSGTNTSVGKCLFNLCEFCSSKKY